LNFQMKNIFNAAEIEAGQCFPLLSRFDISELIEEIVVSFTHHAAKKNVSFTQELDRNSNLVSDREKIEMILLNLVSNAVKFSNPDTEVIIKTTNKEGALTISVQDFGVGIEDQNLDQIYDRFKQLDSGTRKEFGGHGLGLSIVHSLVDIMDGTLQIASKVDQGTHFEISLPPKVLEVDELDDEILFDSEGKGEIF
ncbi:MAG: HAMP domain-containing sensor histidine kinase, partial [Bacteroidota bacterium]